MEVSEKEKHTLFCGNLSPSVTEELLYELFLQVGPVERVSIPKDKRGQSRSFGFVTFKHGVSVPYAFKLMSKERLFGRNLRLQAKGYNLDNQYSVEALRKTKSCPTGITFERRNGRPTEVRPPQGINSNNFVMNQNLGFQQQQFNSFAGGAQPFYNPNNCQQFPSRNPNCNGVFDPEASQRIKHHLQMLAQQTYNHYVPFNQQRPNHFGNF